VQLSDLHIGPTLRESFVNRVVDTADGIGFLDIRPVFKGHVLVVPRP